MLGNHRSQRAAAIAARTTATAATPLTARKREEEAADAVSPPLLLPARAEGGLCLRAVVMPAWAAVLRRYNTTRGLDTTAGFGSTGAKSID